MEEPEKASISDKEPRNQQDTLNEKVITAFIDQEEVQFHIFLLFILRWKNF